LNIKKITKKKLQNYNFVIGFWRRLVITFALYKSFILCTCTKSNVRFPYKVAYCVVCYYLYFNCGKRFI